MGWEKVERMKCDNCSGTGTIHRVNPNWIPTPEDWDKYMHLIQITCPKCKGSGEYQFDLDNVKAVILS
jgi:DnaJ-class molecular chaperone